MSPELLSSNVMVKSRLEEEALHPSCTVPTVQASGGKVIIWRVFLLSWTWNNNTRAHRVRIVDNWFQEHEGSFIHMNLPPQNPDINLNGRENLLDIFQMGLMNKTNLPLSIEDLGDKLVLLWPNIFLQALH
ncbi:hypothetical protein AVEN_230014-1 [Araneus ventricosus]|uniref:Uncharacterized protein n=1 Tax=Araneus ventricosus TaxID=182803 RepID=A0A4Y2CUN7_ARAVE|nr:hypothetical protein AVEN_230014-1 [Araneus ventricosus]